MRRKVAQKFSGAISTDQDMVASGTTQVGGNLPRNVIGVADFTQTSCGSGDGPDLPGSHPNEIYCSKAFQNMLHVFRNIGLEIQFFAGDRVGETQ